ncbi:MAG TPA: AI-2E family transporter [Thermodesulfovibrionales bacterium]|nr:AI-2E family transporter [Thermodesulfovibrionales bacterium]
MNEERHKGGTSLTDLRKLRHQMPRWVLALLVFGVAAVVASRITHLLMMLIAAAIIAYIFSSVICALERLGIKRSVAVILLFVLVTVFVIAADLIFIPDLKQEIMNSYAKFPEFSRQTQDALLFTAEKYPFIESSITKLVDDVFGPSGFLERTLSASEILMQATPFIMALILVPFFVFFLLKDWPGVMKRVMDWIPPSYVETTISVIAEINILVGKYLRGLAGDCFVVGVLASVGLWLIGINYPIMLGILSGVANIVPYLGPIIGCTISSLVALMQYQSFDPVLNVVVLYLAVKLLDDLVIQPLMIGKSVHLHPMLLVITLIVGEKLFGIMGMILGVPFVTAAQKTAAILLEHRRETHKRVCAERLILHRLGKSPVRPI